jgi:hypothetical protein
VKVIKVKQAHSSSFFPYFGTRVGDGGVEGTRIIVYVDVYVIGLRYMGYGIYFRRREKWE